MKTIPILCCSILMLTVASVAVIPTARERQADDTGITPLCESSKPPDDNGAPLLPPVGCLSNVNFSTPRCDSDSHPVCPPSGDDSYILMPACLPIPVPNSHLTHSPTCVKNDIPNNSSPDSKTEGEAAPETDDAEESYELSIPEYNYDTNATPSCDMATTDGQTPSCPGNPPSSFPSCSRYNDPNGLPHYFAVLPVCRRIPNLDLLFDLKCLMDSEDGETDMSIEYSATCLGILPKVDLTTTIPPEQSTTDDVETTTVASGEPNTDAPTTPAPPDDAETTTTKKPMKTIKKKKKNIKTNPCTSGKGRWSGREWFCFS